MTQPKIGVAETVATGIRRILAPNPGPMTYWGTNTYLVGKTDVAVIDPGPDDADHLDAILGSVADARVTRILITHAHRDHTGLATRLHEETGAEIWAYGAAKTGRTQVMQDLADAGMATGGEGVDMAFAPHQTLADGDTMEVEDFVIETLHTPGHFAGHLSFRIGDVLLSGDHIMDWSTTIISPPDGDVAAFMASARRLQELDLATLLPGHGKPIVEPQARLSALIDHRLSREAQILDAVSREGRSLEAITRAVYTDIPETLLPAAARNTLAHLIDLTERGHVKAEPFLSETALFTRA